MRTCYVFKDTRTIADLVQPGELTENWTITRINVPREFRSKGVGTKMLEEILTDADIAQITLQLEPRPSDGLNYTQLKNWYRGHGFKMTQQGYMKRRPSQIPSVLVHKNCSCSHTPWAHHQNGQCAHCNCTLVQSRYLEWCEAVVKEREASDRMAAQHVAEFVEAQLNPKKEEQ